MNPQPRFDERAITAGTTMRFVLLVALLVVSSGAMVTQVLHIRAIAPSQHGTGCLLSAGADPFDGTDTGTLIAGLNQYDAYEACVDRFEPAPSWWPATVWTALLVAAAGAVFWAIPRWKARRGRSLPLHLMDFDGQVGRELAQFSMAAGLGRVPRAVVDPTVTTATAVVFGRNRRPVIRLHGGLLARRSSDPDRYRAVLLHELAHVRNGDITLTYATIALWRVFLLLVLLPYAVWLLYDLPAKTRAVDWEQQAPGFTRSIVLVIAMTALVYLARSDVLRSREIHADLTALRWGADPHGWTGREADPTGGALRRTVRSFVQLWRTHPQWELRRRSLADPAALFELRALPMFLTGAAAALFGDQIGEYLGSRGQSGAWVQQATELIAAGLVTGVAAVALWRAVV
ncbi:M48 family metalloprotease, partial [Streptomyces sp. FH025]|uniref:M48 family metalloprotease n=1 Tax=Streptomyces sp. FH025 TaxID=2815937 RepID=UPI001A9D7125